MHNLESDLIVVGSEEVRLRIDRLLALKFPSQSRTYIQYLIENQCVFLNGQSVKKRIIPNVGDEIEIFFQYPPEIDVKAQDIPLDILYEDEDIVLVNKEAGMVVHPAAGNPDRTFVNALLHHCKKLAPSDDPLRPGIVHRLDKDTSGVLIAAKTRRAHQKLLAQFAHRLVEKKYLAICANQPKNTTLKTFLSRDTLHRQKMTVSEKGRVAITTISVLAYNGSYSLVLAQPVTGRTHQIRVHLQHLNAPILGDQVYGNEKLNKKYHLSRQLLHAYQIKFTHPSKNVPMEFVAPLPKDLKEFLKSFQMIDKLS